MLSCISLGTNLIQDSVEGFENPAHIHLGTELLCSVCTDLTSLLDQGCTPVKVLVVQHALSLSNLPEVSSTKAIY